MNDVGFVTVVVLFGTFIGFMIALLLNTEAIYNDKLVQRCFKKEGIFAQSKEKMMCMVKDTDGKFKIIEME